MADSRRTVADSRSLDVKGVKRARRTRTEERGREMVPCSGVGRARGDSLSPEKHRENVEHLVFSAADLDFYRGAAWVEPIRAYEREYDSS